MPATLNGSGIVFGDGSIQYTDATRILTREVMLPRSSIGTPSGDRGVCSWHHAASPINVRGRMYTSMYNVYVAGSGKSAYWTWALVGNCQITVQNLSQSTLRVNVISGLYDGTDDASQWMLYKDGTVSNSYTHSGGTLLYNSGSAGRTGSYGSPSLNTATVTDDIPGNTSRVYTLYSGVMSGSSGDDVRPYLSATFNAFV